MFEFSCKVFESQRTRLSEARHSHFRVMMSKLGRLAEDGSSQATAKRLADLEDLLGWEGRLHYNLHTSSFILCFKYVAR